MIVAIGARPAIPRYPGHRKKARPQYGNPSQTVEILPETVRAPAAEAAEPALPAHRQAGDHSRRFDTGVRNRGVSGQAGTEGHRPGDIGQPGRGDPGGEQAAASLVAGEERRPAAVRRGLCARSPTPESPSSPRRANVRPWRPTRSSSVIPPIPNRTLYRCIEGQGPGDPSGGRREKRGIRVDPGCNRRRRGGRPPDIETVSIGLGIGSRVNNGDSTGNGASCPDKQKCRSSGDWTRVNPK